MVIITTENELLSSVAPARLFKAIVHDSANFFPKALPNFVKSVEIIEGDGGPGSIKKFTLSEGYVKQKVDVVDEENYMYNYTIVEGSVLSEALEKVSNEYKLEGKSEGGSMVKVTRKYYTKGDALLTQDFLKDTKDITADFAKAIDLYLLANPHYN